MTFAMNDVLTLTLFSLFGKDFNLMEVVGSIVSLAILFFAYRRLMDYFSPKIQRSLEITKRNKTRLFKIIRRMLVFLVSIVLVTLLNVDHNLFTKGDFNFTILHILKALFLWQLAQLLDWVINNLFIDYFYPQGSSQNDLKNTSSIHGARRTVQYSFYLIVALYIVDNFNLDYAFKTIPIKGGEIVINISTIMNAVLAIYIAQLIVWVIIHIPLLKLYARRNVDVGAQYAINQLVKYVVYTFALLYALTTFGINISLILGGAAALLVGIGLGLQQTFNDFISGIVLLFERTVSVGDVLEFAGTVGVVKKIGLRSSIIHTRPNVSMIVPNHLLVNEHVTNWTHFDDSIRFTVEVGVAYGSDTALVKSLLIKAVDENPYVLNTPSPFVRFLAFGDSSLNFAVYFFSKEYLIIEDIKSDIRLYIDKLFREYKVIVPFPQRVITMNKD